MVMVANKTSGNGKSTDFIMTVATAITIVVTVMLPTPIRSASSSRMNTLSYLPSTLTSSVRVSKLSTSGDFDKFNKIFENASIFVPEEFEVSERVGFADLDINIRNIKCYDMTVGNIAVDHEQKSDTIF